jgi:hypothetical protein
LRRVAAGEAMNEKPDWSNIIEELAAVGRSIRGDLSAAVGLRPASPIVHVRLPVSSH